MKTNWLKYLASYFYLVTIKKIPSEYNPGLCLQMEAGKLILNTTNANYSYGNLHTVFEDIFEIIELGDNPPAGVLILGLGGGSVIDIMQRQYGLNPSITAVEIDPAIIDALKYWDNLNLANTKVVCADAFEAVKAMEGGFDLIITDIFVDLDVHPSVRKPEFILNLKSLINPGGTILINYVVNTNSQKEEFAEFQLMLMNYFKDLKGHHLMGINRVLEIKTT